MAVSFRATGTTVTRPVFIKRREKTTLENRRRDVHTGRMLTEWWQQNERVIAWLAVGWLFALWVGVRLASMAADNGEDK